MELKTIKKIAKLRAKGLLFREIGVKLNLDPTLCYKIMKRPSAKKLIVK